MKKFYVYFWVTAFVLFLVNMHSLHAQNNEAYVLLTEYTIEESNMDKAIDLLSEIQTQTLENEESCTVFEILLSDEDTSKVFVYESYESEAAYKKHAAAAYFKNNAPKLKPLVKATKKTKLIPINQEGFSDGEV